MTTLISASILSADFGNLKDELKRAQDSGCDMIHFDVMDGHFVPNISYGVPVLKSIKKYSLLPFDVHLMITEPERYVEAFKNAGADIITFHEETECDKDALIDKIHSLGMKAGMSVKPNTPVSALYPYLNKLDMALVMTVEPGFGGQGFMEFTLDKIASLRAQADSLNIPLDIEVDGGITDKTAPRVRHAGANVLVSGSYLFKSDNMRRSASLLR
jgi:ribulose-phosphate 3-epimerase